MLHNRPERYLMLGSTTVVEQRSKSAVQCMHCVIVDRTVSCYVLNMYVCVVSEIVANHVAKSGYLKTMLLMCFRNQQKVMSFTLLWASPVLTCTP
mmetsp:Transcript_41205/g.76255  ORF Transcript_41205/g.76255 Transcript_41205/m.76255 type:complete len:95 (+) Transcript_41205:890-1174(+)